MNGNQLRAKHRFISHPVVCFADKFVIIRYPIKWLFVELFIINKFLDNL